MKDSKVVRWKAFNEKAASESGLQGSLVASGSQEVSDTASAVDLVRQVLTSLSGFCLDEDLVVEITEGSFKATIRF